MKKFLFITLLSVLLTACAAPTPSATVPETMTLSATVPPSEVTATSIPNVALTAAPTNAVSEATLVANTAKYSGWVEAHLNTSNENGGFTYAIANGDAGGVKIPAASIEIDEHEILTTNTHKITLNTPALVFEYVFTNYFYHGPNPHKSFEKPTEADREAFRQMWIAAQQPGADSSEIRMNWIANDLQTPEFDERPMLLEIFGNGNPGDARAINDVRIIFVDPDNVDGNVKITNSDWKDGFSVNVDGSSLIFFIAKNDSSKQEMQATAEFMAMFRDFIRLNTGVGVRIKSVDKDFVNWVKGLGLKVD